MDSIQTFAFKQYLEDLCRDFSVMLSSERTERAIIVEGIEIELPTVIGIPLVFVANELITNAVKYGTGRITVGLESNPGKGYTLSVANDGPVLPDGFNPASGNGLGMRIIRVSCRTHRRRIAIWSRRSEPRRSIYRAVLMIAVQAVCGNQNESETLLIGE